MRTVRRTVDGRDAWLSDEFAAFAIKYLGFDPREFEFSNMRSLVINLNQGEIITFTTTSAGKILEYVQEDAT